MYKCICLLSLLFISSTAFGLTGDELLKQCRAPEGSLGKAACQGYILGTVSSASILMVSIKRLKPEVNDFTLLFCVAPSL